MKHSFTLLFFTLIISAFVPSITYAQDSNCRKRILVGMGHADDALAFFANTISDGLEAGDCFDFVSLTSYYDDGTVISGREEGARALYEHLTEGFLDSRPQTFATVPERRYGTLTARQYNVHDDDKVTLTFFRLPASTYPGRTRGAIYDQIENENLIAALSTLIVDFQPSEIYTLDTDGRLVGNGPCDVQRNGLFSENECDHYDHVGTAILFEKAHSRSRLDIDLQEYTTYSKARGFPVNSNIAPEACRRFCEARDIYLGFDPLALATPWGAFLSSPEFFKTSQPAQPLLGQLRSELGTDICIGPANGALSNLTPIVILDSCADAPEFTLTPSGNLTVDGRCVEAGARPNRGSRLFLFGCGEGQHQKWRYDSDRQVLINTATNFVIDSPNSGTAPGTRMTLWNNNGTRNQQWVF